MPLKVMAKHRPGGQQVIQRSSFREILSLNGKLIIPLFQRSYCWNEKQIEDWWQDIMVGVSDNTKNKHEGSENVDDKVKKEVDQGLLVHNVNLIRLKKTERNGILEILIVDGQQRITTTSILLAAVLQFGNTFQLTSDTTTEWELLKSDLNQSLQFNNDLKLIPSIPDRAAYREAILRGNIDEYKDSCQVKALAIFKRNLEKLLDSFTKDSEKIDQLKRIVVSALDFMCPMLVELTEADNLAEMFQWYQEKSLLGLAALLKGVPGVQFAASDLVRNFVMSTALGKSLDEQEQIYRDLWLEKIEIPCKGQTDLYLDVFLKTKGVSSLQDTGRFVSEFEEQIRTIINSRGNDEEDEDIERKPDVDLSGMMLFCRFHSFLYSLDIDGDISKINLFVQQFSIFLENI